MRYHRVLFFDVASHYFCQATNKLVEVEVGPSYIRAARSLAAFSCPVFSNENAISFNRTL
jgi:hypothetical protein